MSRIRTYPNWDVALAGLALLAFVAVAPGQVTVETIGGGVRTECGPSAGFAAGKTWTAAQFNQPYATALDSLGDLWVADLKNKDVEQITAAGNRATSVTYDYASGGSKHPFPNVIGVAIDSGDNLYVLTKTTLFKFQQVTESFPDLNDLFEISLGSFASGSATAIAVVNDANTNIYISFTNSAGGTIIRIPQVSEFPPYIGAISTVVSNYSFAPAGLSMQGNGQLAVSDTLHNGIFAVATSAGSIPQLITGGLHGPGLTNGSPLFACFNQPHGLAASGDGRIVVCDTLNNAMRVIDTSNNTTTLYGTTSAMWTATCCNCDPAQYAGWVDGMAGTTRSSASSRQPVSVTIAPSGTLFVTELYYNLIRSVTGSGLTPVTTTNSITYSTNLPTVITEAATSITSTSGTLNASVNPAGSPATVFFYWGTTTNLGTNTGAVIVSTNLGGSNLVSWPLTNLQPNTIIYYQAVAINNASGSNSFGGINSFFTSVNGSILPPPLFTISPSSGYFPECQTITVTSPVTNIYYTENGSPPTTNSAEVVFTGTNNSGLYVGTFQWCNSQEDLSALQMISISGGAASSVLTGGSATTNLLGFVRGPTSGIGSWAYVPLPLTLQSGTAIQSLDFRVEVAANGSAPPITSLSLLTTNDFVQFPGPALGNATNVTFLITPYTNTTTNGMAINATNGSGLLIQNFAVVVILQFQIPRTAQVGQTYSLNVLYPSATFLATNGASTLVPIGTMPAQTLTVSNLPYLAGDTAPANGYDSGEFGDGALTDADIENVLYASMGIRVPPVQSDAYNAMCVLPQTRTHSGNGLITIQDWQEIQARSLGLDTNNWLRSWSVGGVLLATNVNWGPGGPPAVTTAESAAVGPGDFSPPGLVWQTEGSISAGSLTHLRAGSTCSLPVHVNIRPGYALTSCQFRAIVSPNGSGPPVGQVSFTPAPGIPSPLTLPGLSPNDIVTAWAANDFTNPLQGSNFLGTITFKIPSTAKAGESYVVHFVGVDGTDGSDDFAMESFPGYAWVGSGVLRRPSIISDEWKLHFFGSLTNKLAGDDVDADGDGASNWQEYLAGTDPTNPLSKFAFNGAGLAGNGAGGLSLSWPTAPGKTYILESIPAVGGEKWTAINTNIGDGYTYQFNQNNYNGDAQYYRILLKP